MNTTVIESPQPLASSLVERWYVVIVMCLVYAISIADRYVVFEKGHVVCTVISAALAADPSVRRRYLQV